MDIFTLKKNVKSKSFLTIRFLLILFIFFTIVSFDTSKEVIAANFDFTKAGSATTTCEQPSALGDEATTQKDTPILIDVLANDRCVPMSGTFTVANPSNGSVTIDNGGTPTDPSDDTLTYIPNNGFIGSDTFKYTISNASGKCSTATVKVCVKKPLIAVVDDTAVTELDTPVTVAILENDSNIPTEGTLTITNPSHGTVVINNGGTPDDPSDDTVTYTPNKGFKGADTFKYTISDKDGKCYTANVAITVKSSCGCKMIKAVDDTATTEFETPITIAILENDTNVPSDGTLTTTTPSNGTVVVNDGGTPNDPSDDTVTYTPNDGYIGEDTFDYTLCNAAGKCSTATVTVTVTAPAPMVEAADDTATTEFETPITIAILENDTNVPSDGTLTTTTPSNGTVVVNDGGTPNDPSDDTVTYTPNDGYIGEDTFDYTLCDGLGNCSTATVTVTVTAPAPMVEAVDDTATTEFETPITIAILENDTNVPSDGTLTTTMPSSGTVVINNGGTPNDPSDDTVTYTPNDGYIGEDTFDYTLCDGLGNCSTATVTVTVTAPVPMVEAADDTATTEFETPITIAILENDTNVPSDGTLTTTMPSSGTVVINNGGTPNDPSDDTVTYTPNDGYIGEDTFDYTLCDGLGNCSTATVTVTVTAPVPMVEAADDTVTTEFETPITIAILENDTNVPSDGTLTTTTPSNGTVVVNDGGTPNDPSDDTVTYTPNDGFVGEDTFDYTLCDGLGNCSTATVTVTVDIFIIEANDDTYNAATNGGLVEGNVLDNDFLNGDFITPNEVVITSTPTDYLIVNNDGTVTVTPNTPVGTYTIAYTICQIAVPSNCDTAIVTVVISEDLLAIDAVDDDYSSSPVLNGGGSTVNGNILSNDTLNGAPISLTDVILTAVPTGPLTINQDGTITVAPNTISGTYTIEYTICQIGLPSNCDTATVTVVVRQDILVNQLLTPNGDGKNDFLFIRGVENAFNNSIKIFNRWGTSVYEGVGYNNQNNVFDGHSKSRSTIAQGDYLPAGVYFYIFEYQNIDNKHITDNGYIYISN